MRYDVSAAMVNIAEAPAPLRALRRRNGRQSPNCDDAGVARNIFSQLDRHGQPTARTRARLTRWCDTNGTLNHVGCLSRKQFATQFTVESCPVKIDSTVMPERKPTSRYLSGRRPHPLLSELATIRSRAAAGGCAAQSLCQIRTLELTSDRTRSRRGRKDTLALAEFPF